MSKITDKRLKELERAEAKLWALEAGGVDNWDGIDFALEDWRKENEREECMEELFNDLEIAFGECAYEPSERGAGIAFNEDVFKEVMGIFHTHKIYFKEACYET